MATETQEAESEEYESLVSRIRKLEDSLDELNEDMTEDDFISAVRDIDNNR